MIRVGADSVVTRPFDASAPGEREYVLCAWFESLLDIAPPSHKCKRSSVWLRLCRKVIRQHVDLDTVTIACLEDTPGVLVGFACKRGEQLLYAYVTKRLRGLGIGTALIGRKPGGQIATTKASEIPGGRAPSSVTTVSE